MPPKRKRTEPAAADNFEPKWQRALDAAGSAAWQLEWLREDGVIDRLRQAENLERFKGVTHMLMAAMDVPGVRLQHFAMNNQQARQYVVSLIFTALGIGSDKFKDYKEPKLPKADAWKTVRRGLPIRGQYPPPTAASVTKKLKSVDVAAGLANDGILRIPNAITPDQATQIIADTTGRETALSKGGKRLAPTSGAGCSGVYLNLPPLDSNAAWITTIKTVRGAVHAYLKENGLVADEVLSDTGHQCIKIKYEIGGLNYAHTDQNCVPYQALLMLSRPGIDFNGGSMYVTHESDPVATRREVPCESAGDLIIFRCDSDDGGRKLRHGMTEVTAGSVGEAETERHVIGITFNGPKA